MDELTAIQQLLAEPPPGPDVVEAARARLARLAQGGASPLAAPPGPRRYRWDTGRPVPQLRRWPRWVAPVSAAAAVVLVAGASLTVSRAISGHGAGPAPAGGTAAVLAQVPRFYVSIPGDVPGRVVVRATATGQLTGTIPVPRPAKLISLVASAGNGRAYVLAASRGQVVGQPVSEGPSRFYLLTLSPSGHPGPLKRLPIPEQTPDITGLALSPDGTKLAVAVAPASNRPRIEVFSLATGAEHDWVWPATAVLGWSAPGFSNEFLARSLSWTADGRTLLFLERSGPRNRQIAQARLLATTATGRDLRASSRRVPIPSAELFRYGRAHQPPFGISGPLTVTGDGSRVIGVTTRNLPHPAGHPQHPVPFLEDTISVFSVRTGKIVQVLHRQQLTYDNGSGVLFVDQPGTAVIAAEPRPRPSKSGRDDLVIGIQTPTTFTPLRPAVQRAAVRSQPAW
jgi:hypothetical protein